MPDLYFRLRIRNAADTADALVISSVRTDANPYIAAIPQGDGQEVDLLTGAVRTGAYNVTVVDAVTGSDGTGTLRLVTNVLTDSNGDQQLLSRRAFVEVSPDGVTWPNQTLLRYRVAFDNLSTATFSRTGNATFTQETTPASPTSGPIGPSVWMAGYISNIVQSDAITYTFTISDARRVEQNATAFTWGVNPQDAAKSERLLFPQRGCLIGGPIVGGFGPTKDSGGVVTTFTASETLDGETVYALKFVEGVVPGTKEKMRDFARYAAAVNRYLAPYAESATATAFTNNEFDPLKLNDLLGLRQYNFPALIIQATSLDGTQQWAGTLRAFLPQVIVNRISFIAAPTTARNPYIYGTITSGPTSGGSIVAPSANQPLLVRVIARDVSEKAPVYFDLHPVEVVTKLYDSVNIPYRADSATGSWQWMRDQLGPQTRLAARITEPTNLGQFLEQSIFGPFGFSARTNASGVREFILTRKIGAIVPTISITTADVRDEAPNGGFALDEATVCTQVRYAYRILSEPVLTDDSNTPPPPDGIVESENVTLIASGDTTTFSTREVAYTIPGMVHQAASFTPAMDPLILGVEQEIFSRFKRGSPVYQVSVLATSAAANLQVGDECLIAVSYVPNKGYRIGESTVGARVAQVVRRDEFPEGPAFKLVDSGPSLQLATAPTISIAASTGSPQTVARFTVTNASTLNTAGAAVEVEWATGSAPTTNGTLFTRYRIGTIPTAAVSLPNVAPGSTVYVRARSVSPLNRPSAWSSWASVTLTNWAAPSAVTAGTATAESIPVSWTNNAANYPVNVYLAPGSTAPSDWGPYLVRTFPAGSTQTTIRGLTASTAYIIGVAHFDPATGARTAVATTTKTTAASSAALTTAITWFTPIPTQLDAQYPSGIAFGIYAGNEGLAVRIQRSPNGSTNWVTIAEVPGTTTVFVDPLPSDGVTRYYRAWHIDGTLDGPVTPVVSATPSNIPPTVQRPPIPAASLTVNAEVTDAEYEISWAGGPTDTVTLSIDGGAYATPSASPILVARDPYEGGVDKVYTFKAVGLLGDEKTATIVVARQLPFVSNPPSVTVTSITLDSATAVTVGWDFANIPAGSTWTVNGRAFDVGSGNVTNSGIALGTSPKTRQLTGFTGLGAGTLLRAIVTAKDSGGNTVASDTLQVTL